jgi:hypothetical protein
MNFDDRPKPPELVNFGEWQDGAVGPTQPCWIVGVIEGDPRAVPADAALLLTVHNSDETVVRYYGRIVSAMFNDCAVSYQKIAPGSCGHDFKVTKRALMTKVRNPKEVNPHGN